MRECTIVLVRHPETVANTDGIFVGRGDSPYTKVGQLELRRARRRICTLRPDGIWSSPLRRALTLAQGTADRCGLKVRVDEGLMELDFGAVEGLTLEEITAAGLALDYASSKRPVAQGGESRDDLARRVEVVLRDVTESGGTQVVVTHGGVVRAALVQLLGLPSSAIWAFHIHNAQFAVVRVMDGHGILEEYVHS